MIAPASAIVLRDEAPGDADTIAAVTEAAFRHAEHRSGTEALIVAALRERGELTVSKVALLDGRIVGHAAASPVTVDGRDLGWFGLGPVSVLPDRQRSGIGVRLVEAVLNQLRNNNAGGCVVLGDPAYYARFGFQPDARLRLPGVPAEYFQSLVFAGEMPTGDIAYSPAFDTRA